MVKILKIVVCSTNVPISLISVPEIMISHWITWACYYFNFIMFQVQVYQHLLSRLTIQNRSIKFLLRFTFWSIVLCPCFMYLIIQFYNMDALRFAYIEQKCSLNLHTQQRVLSANNTQSLYCWQYFFILCHIICCTCLWERYVLRQEITSIRLV